MTRALRIQCAGGRYHVTARGNDRKQIFWDDTDRFHFLELLSELSLLFGSRVHAYAFMDNHYHLLLETPEPNLSRAMQWCNVSYSVWFNLRHRRSGHVLQGRFGADLVQDDAGWQQVARYVHLNPVRVAHLGLNKSSRAASRAGPIPAPSSGLVAERLKVLREYRWSSYPGYAGYRHPLSWGWREPLSVVCGGNTEEERRAALREYTELGKRVGDLDYAGVSKAIARFQERMRKDPELSKHVTGIQLRMSK